MVGWGDDDLSSPLLLRLDIQHPSCPCWPPLPSDHSVALSIPLLFPSPLPVHPQLFPFPPLPMNKSHGDGLRTDSIHPSIQSVLPSISIKLTLFVILPFPPLSSLPLSSPLFPSSSSPFLLYLPPC